MDKARTILHASAELEGFGMTFRTNDRVIATGRIKGKFLRVCEELIKTIHCTSGLIRIDNQIK